MPVPACRTGPASAAARARVPPAVAVVGRLHGLGAEAAAHSAAAAEVGGPRSRNAAWGPAGGRPAGGRRAAARVAAREGCALAANRSRLPAGEPDLAAAAAVPGSQPGVVPLPARSVHKRWHKSA